MKLLLCGSLLFTLTSACGEPPPAAAPSHRVVFVRATEPLPEPVLEPPPARVTTTDPSVLSFQISAEPGSGPMRNLYELRRAGSRSLASQVAIRFSFRNVSNDTIRVLRHPHLKRRGGLHSDITLEIVRASDGSTPERICRGWGCSFGGWEPSLKHYIQLEPGEDFSFTDELECQYALPDEGPWRIVAHYHDERERPPVDEHTDSIAWFDGTLDSNTIEITVKPWSEVEKAWAEEEKRLQEEAERLLQE